MKKKFASGVMAVLLFLLIWVPEISGQPKSFKGRVTDTQNNQYNLSEMTVSGTAVIHCLLKDTFFTVGFDRIQSLTITPGGESPFPGYVPAALVLTSGTHTNLYVNLENYRVEGKEENLNIRIRIPLLEILRLEVIHEKESVTSIQ